MSFAGTQRDDAVWEERWHPLREEWVIVAGHRQNRPWSGETVNAGHIQGPDFDGNCYLCPGNVRVSGAQNEHYSQTFVFDNDHPCVGPNAPVELITPASPYRNRPASGIARVVCYSPKHNQTLSRLAVVQIDELLAVWQQQYLDLASRGDISHVLIFENKGEAVGVSNPHPHCQIYATNFIFKYIQTEANVCARHLSDNGKVLFQEILLAEQSDGRRIIAESDSAVAFVPYFARYACEVFVAPKETHASLATLNTRERRDLAKVMSEVLIKFDNLWHMPFPYVMALHQAPTDGGDYSGFHFHIEFHPPLRKPNLIKYLAGPEIGGGNFVSDTSPEKQAAELKLQPCVHYADALELEAAR